MCSTSRPGRFTFRNDTLSIIQEAGWAPGPVWTRAENVAPTGIRTPERQPVASRYTGYDVSVMLFSWSPRKEPPFWVDSRGDLDGSSFMHPVD